MIMIDCERKKINLGDFIVVWDNWYAKIYRCQVVGFTPKKIRIKNMSKNYADDRIVTLKFPDQIFVL